MKQHGTISQPPRKKRNGRKKEQKPEKKDQYEKKEKFLERDEPGYVQGRKDGGKSYR